MKNPETAPEERAIRRQAAAPNLFLGALFAAAAIGVLFNVRFDAAWTASIMITELFAIHSFPFMMLIASCRPKTPFGKRTRKTVFWMTLCVYLLFALKEGGLSGVIAFAGLTASTYLGYLLRRTSPDAIAELVARWGMSFVAYFGAAFALGVPRDVDRWTESAKMPLFGMLYFTAIGLLDLYGFYQLPKVRQAAANVKAVLEAPRKA